MSQPKSFEIFDIQEFIATVKSHPAIYDSSEGEFYDKLFVAEQWEQIALQFNTNVYNCKAKWIGLRTSFARQLRNENKKDRDSLVGDWYLTENMSFMRNYMRIRKKRTQNDEDVENADNSSISNSSFNFTAIDNADFPNYTVDIKNEPGYEDDNESSKSLEFIGAYYLSQDFKEGSEAISVESSNTLSNSIKYEPNKEITRSPDSQSHFIVEESEYKVKQSDSFQKTEIEPKQEQHSFNRKSIHRDDQQSVQPLKKKPKQQEVLQTVSSSLGSEEHEDPNMTFIRSILPDFNKLTARRQRLLKQEILQNLNKLLDDEENNSSIYNAS